MVTFVSYGSISAAILATTLSSGWYTSSQLVGAEGGLLGSMSALLSHLLRYKIYVLALMNTALCLFILLGKFVQVLFFGKLRVSESKNLYDRSLNYTLFKIIFVGAILEPSDIPQFLVCTVWFSVLGFLKVYSLLCRDRFEFLLTTANVRWSSHARLVALLSIIQVTNAVWFALCLFFFLETGYSTIFLLTFENITLWLKTSEILLKYFLHMIRRSSNWEARATWLYYTQLLSEFSILLVTLLHYTHILFLHGFSLTLNAILFMHIRIVLGNLREKITSYSNYLKMARDMRNKYPNVTPEQLAEYDDDCAICREPMTAAKKLPCSHIFHEGCLRLWLEHHHSCPTCRHQLINNETTVPDANAEPNARRGWFPFRFIFRRRAAPVTPEMINAVREVAPHVSEEWIIRDLQRTGSTNATLERIFEQFPPPVEEANEGERQMARVVPEENQEQAQEQEQEQGAPRSVRNQESSSREEESDESLEAQLQRVSEELDSLTAAEFSSSSRVREQRLEQRKELMKKRARLLFLKKKVDRQAAQARVILSESSHSSSELPEPSWEPLEQEEVKKEEVEESNVPEFSRTDSIEIRRRRALEAAERRMRDSRAAL